MTHTNATAIGEDLILHLTGVVSSGLGEGRFFTSLPWAAAEFEKKLGFIPYPGTFNVTVTDALWEQARAQMDRQSGIAIEPPPGFCKAKCFRVAIAHRVVGAAVVPEIPGYPRDKLEVLAPIAVRTALGVEDGDEIVVEMSVVTEGAEEPSRGAFGRQKEATHE